MFVLIISQQGGLLLPVESDTKHPVVSESRDEQFDIFGAFSILGQGSLSQRYRPHSMRQENLHLNLGFPSEYSPAPVSISEGLRRAVAAPQPRPLGQDELQLRRGSARYQGPDQSQRVLVEISLGGKY